MTGLKWILAGVLLFWASQATAASEVFGTWETEGGKSHVKIVPCGDKACGRIVWLKEPNDEKGKPKLDANNEDESKRRRAIQGLDLLEGFHREEPGVWEGGRIYNPEDGKTYSASMELAGEDSLQVEGCVFIFCKEQTWTRVE